MDDISLSEIGDRKSNNATLGAPVGTYKPNDLGLYYLGGNVRKWCEDEYKPSEPWHLLRDESWLGYSNKTIRFWKSLPNRPPGPIPMITGVWRLSGYAFRSSWRDSKQHSYRDDESGFRVVCE